ncbi:hypothetical protein Bca4012_011200 [Brassica carinata]
MAAWYSSELLTRCRRRRKLPIDQDSKVRTFKDDVDFPSIDSYLDFDSCNWLGNNPNIEEFGVKDTDFDFFEEDEMEDIGQGGVPENQNSVLSESMSEPKLLCDDVVAERAVKELDTAVSDNSKPMEDVSASVDCPTVKLDEPELKKTDVCLVLGLEKVSLNMGDDEKRDEAKGKSISIAESESDTSSSSSSSSTSASSSSEDEEESDEEDSEEEDKCEDQMVIVKEDGVAGELEQGEIESEDEVEEDEDDDDDDEVNEMIAWSNDEDEDLGLQTKDPIRSKNELKELPPVPAVDVSLEPHHVTLPVGVVLSVMSAQVIVEGMETHSPLTEGSILWITESRTPLGLVDEIFTMRSSYG